MTNELKKETDYKNESTRLSEIEGQTLTEEIDENDNQELHSDDYFYRENIATISNEIIPLETTRKYLINNQQECDNIILKNGEDINAKITEINSNEIKYKRCDNLDGPVYTIDKSSVLMVKYVNGTKEVFSQKEELKTSNETNKDQISTPPVKRKVEAFSLLSFFIGIAGLLIGIFASMIGGIVLGVIAFIFGIVGLVRASKYSDRLYGKGFAVLGLIFGIASIIVCAVVLSLVL